MKIKLKLLILCGIIVLIAFSCGKNETASSSNDSFIILNQIDAKVFRVLESLDENNQQKDYSWAISTTKGYIDSLDTPIDDNILAPNNLLDSFKTDNLKVIVSGKKYVKKNHALTSPDFRTGFGYVFEITEIKRKK